MTARHNLNKFKRILLLVLSGVFLMSAIWLLFVHVHFSLGWNDAIIKSVNVAGKVVFGSLFRDDLDKQKLLTKKYNISNPKTSKIDNDVFAWKELKVGENGFNIVSYKGPEFDYSESIPFVYEHWDSPHLQQIVSSYNLRQITKAKTEYESMLKLGKWIGTQWDHGADKVPGGTSALEISNIIEAGKHGSKFWCEIAAKVTVQLATALGWPARLITASRDGYAYDHGIAEIWSNQFNKWFMLDTDFNVVFENKGTPLSAYELCHEGEKLEEAGQIKVRHFAPSKPSLPYKDLIPLFNYVHIDMRNDWYSRKLRKGSPAGGDLATWYTTRAFLPPLLTHKIRIDEQDIFDWKVNQTYIHFFYLKEEDQSNISKVRVTFSAYAPYFSHFMVKLDDSSWEKVGGENYLLLDAVGGIGHSLKARIITPIKAFGPVTHIKFYFQKKLHMISP